MHVAGPRVFEGRSPLLFGYLHRLISFLHTTVPQVCEGRSPLFFGHLQRLIHLHESDCMDWNHQLAKGEGKLDKGMDPSPGQCSYNRVKATHVQDGPCRVVVY